MDKQVREIRGQCRTIQCDWIVSNGMILYALTRKQEGTK